MKQFRIIVLLVVFLLGMEITSFGDTKIENVELSFSVGQEPAAGDDVGEVSVSPAGDAHFRVEFANFETESERWTIGERPVIRVELQADDEYYFGYTTKSHFKFSGASNITLKKATRRDKNTTMTVEVYLKRIGGVLPPVEGIEWSSSAIAIWEPMEGAKSYEVRLLRNGSTVTTATTSGTSYNFVKNISKAGDYSFRVRAVSSYDDRKGEWSDESESFDIEKDDIEGLKNSSSSSTSSSSPSYSSQGWMRNSTGWWYSNGDGTWLSGGWHNINNVWYYFNGSGYILTGWQLINGRWYYMNASGAMLTGWQYINNAWYYLDAGGAMLTGWQYINGKWYYMDLSTGVMYANTITPDGYRVDASGARIG